MNYLGNRYVFHAVLPKDWTKADMRAANRLYKTMCKLNGQIGKLWGRGILVEIEKVAPQNKPHQSTPI